MDPTENGCITPAGFTAGMESLREQERALKQGLVQYIRTGLARLAEAGYPERIHLCTDVFAVPNGRYASREPGAVFYEGGGVHADHPYYDRLNTIAYQREPHDIETVPFLKFKPAHLVRIAGDIENALGAIGD
ncbi:MAG: hypothetical protein HYY37_04395 [Candidatus Aenigmarchaeota archaeon]|nr:hypothetical protein [Candidatus Aenigmarchaeota archaeon]